MQQWKPKKKSFLFQQFRAEATSPFQRLLVLPGGDFLRVAGKEDFGNFPAVEFGRAGVDGRREEAVLEGIRECGGLVAQRTGKQAHDRVGNDRGRQFAAAENVIPYRYLTGDEMFADAVVHAFVVSAQDHDILLAGELIGHLLGERLAVGRGEDDLVVASLGLEVLHQVEHGLDHHHHPGVAAEAVVVHLAVASFAVFTDVVDMDFHEPFVAGALDDGVAQRTLEQLRNNGQDIDSHTRCKISDYL